MQPSPSLILPEYSFRTTTTLCISLTSFACGVINTMIKGRFNNGSLFFGAASLIAFCLYNYFANRDLIEIIQKQIGTTNKLGQLIQEHEETQEQQKILNLKFSNLDETVRTHTNNISQIRISTENMRVHFDQETYDIRRASRRPSLSNSFTGGSLEHSEEQEQDYPLHPSLERQVDLGCTLTSLSRASSTPPLHPVKPLGKVANQLINRSGKSNTGSDQSASR